ncbi:MAG: methyltransferase domain-containing protein [Patescibacteria group bacterium]
MQKSKPYHQYTDYDKEPGGLRKLDFIVDVLERNFAGRPKSEIKILDVGCGNGNISLPLASLGYQVLGIDVDFVSINNVQKKNQFSNARFLVFGAEDILKLNSTQPPLNIREDEGGVKFDCIIASEFFEHLEKPQEFAKLTHQVLNSNGLLIASIPNGGSLLENFRWFLNQTGIGRAIKKILRKTILKKETIQSQAESPHVQFFSLRRFKKILESTGFKIQEVKNSSAIFGETFYLFWRFFLKRGSKIFNWMDNYDGKIADIIPKWLGVGWIIVSEKLKIKNGN